MSRRWIQSRGAVLVAGILALAGCGGSDGASGAQGAAGPAGQDGTNGTDGTPGTNGTDALAVAKPESCEGCHPTAGAQHQAVYDTFKSGITPAQTAFSASIVSVVTSAGTNANTYKATVTFTLNKAGLAAGTCVEPASLKQKTMYFVSYDGAGKFPTPAYNQSAAADPTGEKGGSDASSPVNFSFGSMALVDAATCTFKMVKDNLSADPLAAANAFAYGYFGDTALEVPANTNTARHYALMQNMVSVAKVLNGAISYTSSATVSGCEKCHGAPYSKHGYRQATVAGLGDFVACKACHTDFRRGTDGAWYMLADDPAQLAAQGGALTDAQKAKYAYVANVMQDTHNSHAFEFAYPQSMANCTTCHEGHLAQITANTNFKLSTCKSCHPVTGTNADPKRAPALTTLLSAPNVAPYHTVIDLYSTNAATDSVCQACHGNTAVPSAPPFSAIHSGRDAAIYKADGSRYAASIRAQIDSATFDKGTNKLTVKFSVPGLAAGSIVKPTVVVSLYGYNTKDFVVSGHGSQADKTRNLEWTEGATNNSPRLDVVPGATTASWVATADVTTWASKLGDGSVKRAEVAILPQAGADLSKAPQNDLAKAAYNPYVAVAGITRTVSLTTAKATDSALIANTSVYGRDIVDTAKCNKCHEALGTSFHSPSYGSAGVLACRVCHTINDGGSHLEMQSRSIDSYVHAIHSFQAFDIKNVNFADPMEAMEYEHHIESMYPNFMVQNCESCHNPGTYEVPDQSRSLPGVLSASATITGTTRAINGVPSYVTGPAVRACGACHRAELINEDAAGGLNALNTHFAYFGTQVPNDTGVLASVIESMMSIFK